MSPQTRRPRTPRPPKGARWSAALGLLCCSWGCAGAKSEADPVDPWEALQSAELAPFVRAMGAPRSPPIDATNVWSDVPEAAALGKALFFDPQLSADGRVSCAGCHDPAQGWADGLPLPSLDGRVRGGRHTPTVLNAALHRWQFWDGRCDSLWCQAAGPIENPDEMNLGRADLGRVLAADPALGAAYLEVFGLSEELAALLPAEASGSGLPDMRDPARFPPGARPMPADPTAPAHLAYLGMAPADQRAATRLLVDLSQAIAAFEAQVISGPAPIDQYVAAFEAGDRAAAAAALSDSAARGLLRFVTDGQCVFCHTGSLFSNLEFESVGLGARAWLDPADPGRAMGAPAVIDAEFNALSAWSAETDGAAAQRIRSLRVEGGLLSHFKVPSLREVERTAPYMHGGHFDTLEAVVHHYNVLDEDQPMGEASPLLGPLDWSEAEEADVVNFLRALTELTPDPDLRAPPSSFSAASPAPPSPPAPAPRHRRDPDAHARP